MKFKKAYLNAKCPSVQQVYNWINEGKIKLSKKDLCYKKRRGKKTSMMNHTKWNDFKSILIEFNNFGSANDFLITNISFYKNVTRGEYEYDENGNLVSIINQSNNSNNFKYDENNQLIKMTDTKGKDFVYEYDKNLKNRVINIISSTGISNKIIYDSNGNPKTTKIAKKTSKEISSGFYKIRSYGTNKYLKAELNQLLLENNDCSNTIWKFTKVDNSYKISYAVNDCYYLSIFNKKEI